MAKEAVVIFDDTIMDCAQKKEPGIFHVNTRWFNNQIIAYFYVPNTSNMLGFISTLTSV